jgi:hypothetical protein
MKRHAKRTIPGIRYKNGMVFIPIRNKRILVGRPSLAALIGGHGGPPSLRF